MSGLEEEYKKLEDLEFEFNIARISKQPPEIVAIAEREYIKQINKVKNLKKKLKEEQTTKVEGVLLEDLI